MIKPTKKVPLLSYWLSMIEIIKYLLESGVAYVLAERFCPDVLENYFGCQRTVCGRKDNPTLRDFGYGPVS